MTNTNRAEHPLPYDTYREAIERETRRLADALRDADPATAVPSCPHWTLTDLTLHVGALQRWFCTLLSQRVQEAPRSRDVQLGLPEDARNYADWLKAGVPGVAAVLRDTDPAATMWTWGADPHARFWARRMLFETLVHRVDAERTVGRDFDVDPTLAADGIDEFLVNLPYAGLFAPGVTELRGDGDILVFGCTDVGGATGEEWRVRLEPDGFQLLSDPADSAQTPSATVRTTAADLLLLLYGRRSRREPVFDMSGDTALLDRWFTHTAF
ncbi:maleylpyruvate isomerase family mycothiol-dependent enzyme [Streptomyces sp. NPDC001781]